MHGSKVLTQSQIKALNELTGLIGKNNTGGRTLCCLVGSQGKGKTWLVKYILSQSDFGDSKYVSVNELILKIIEDDSMYHDIFNFNPNTIHQDMKRYGSRLRKDIYDVVTERLLLQGLTILDHMELMFTLGLDPITTWYNQAVGQKRVLLVLTGRMSGQSCRCGQQTLTRGDQPIVELGG
ncbi:hypothetical protein LGL08_00175 [Clostridium estertheticum]|uniref:hypothetical protein n=1 Tax=Clostridium estertheticum TaxID=238834 RepID=UPI001CF12BFC|nr:hypothetical protein [Clostridium estertheticum]MCB2305630.1 hypothetical protein [Clostridium estertheticum]MCB2344554.1 hypothetical protein [Clostridium estertheticum]MCB2347986.1 hypothetical protein [Clostridium estertheticum]WAG45630.1 hypothetical protein LL127_19255 [Clostridium estertheticum]